MIGDEGTIQVLEIQGDKVRLGFEFPKETPVHREEVYIQIKESKDDKSERPDNPSSGKE